MAEEPAVDLPRLREFFDATLEVASHLTLANVQHEVLHQACRITGARYGAMALLGAEGGFRELFTEGNAEGITAAFADLSSDTAVLDEVRTTTGAVRVDRPNRELPLEAVIATAIRIRGEAYAVLYVTDPTIAPQFNDADELLLAALATAAAVAIENAQLHEQTEALAVVGERERLARDLHDRVIQRIFATAMSLDATAMQLPEPLRTRVTGAVDDLDATIREIRSTIFELSHYTVESLETEIRDIAAELESALGFVPSLVFTGNTNARLDDTVQLHAVAAAREMLTNVAKHANATAVELRVDVCDQLAITVRDNGIGIPADAAVNPRGLANLSQRAQLVQGTCTFMGTPGGGTTVTWLAKLH